MSHYSCVLVIPDALSLDPGTIPARVEKEMAPFMENCCAEPDKMYMKFYDEEDEMLKQYEEGSREMIVMPDGRLLMPWDDEFKVPPKKGEFPFSRPEAPKHLPRRNVPYKETYSDFDEFAREWYGKRGRDDTYNRYGYWQNPNAKWDWFEVGGRWAGFFQLKPGQEGALGSQYNFSGTFERSEGGKADIVFKLAIDFERMRDEAEAEAKKEYDAVRKAIRGTPEPELWEVIKSKHEPLDETALKCAREQYHAQPRVKAFSEFSRSEEGSKMIGFFGNVEDYSIPRKQYLQNARNHAAVPFALLKDGKWFEQGKMGWWGMASDEKDPETWNSMVNKMYDELPKETLLVAIDCHI